MDSTTKLHCSFKYLLIDNISLRVCTAGVQQVWSGKLHQGVWPSVWHRWKHLWNRMCPLPEKQVCNTHGSMLTYTCTWCCTDNYEITHQLTRKDSLGYHECSRCLTTSKKQDRVEMINIHVSTNIFFVGWHPPTHRCYHVCKFECMNWFEIC